MTPQPDARAAAPSPRPPSRGTPEFKVAGTLQEVIAGWSLVHQAYQRIGLIDANAFGLHTVPQAIDPKTTVIVGYLGDTVVSTLSVIMETDQRVPLQSVYPQELDALRNAGRRLLEVGLLADRREHISRSMISIFEMMRYVFWRSYLAHIDIVIGVHPHHAGFYINSFGFRQIGPPSTHPTVKDHPVVPMWLDLHETTRLPTVPRRLQHYINHPLTDETFACRYDFDPKQVQQSVIGQYLQEKQRQQASSHPAH